MTDVRPADPPDDARSTNRLISASAIMAAGTGVSRIAGFGRSALLAVVLGNGSRQADMFGIANSIPNMVYILLAGGVLNTVFVPQVVRAMRNDPDGGEAYTNRLLTVGLLALGAITVVTTVGAPVIIYVYANSRWRAPGLAAQYDSMIFLAFLCLPQIFFYGANVLMGQVLNARHRFGPMMFSPVANNLISIAVLVVYLLGWPDRSNGAAFTTGQALLLGLGSTLGIVAQALVLVPFLGRAGFHYRPRFDFRHTGLGATARLARWTLAYVLVTQVAVVVITHIATGATAGGRGAGWTVYNNAYLLWILPHSLVTVSLATAMLPAASAMAAAGDLTGVRDEAVATMRLALTALLPAAIGYLVLAQPVTRLLFGNGQGAADAPFVGFTLTALAVGLVPFTLQYICLRAFYALEDTRTPFFIQIGIAGTNVVLAIALTGPVGRPSLTAAGLGLAYSLSYVVGLTLSFRQLRRRLPGLDGGRLGRHAVRVLVAVLPAAAAAWAISWGLGRWSDSRVVLLLGLALSGLVAVGMYVATARLLRITEVTQILSSFTRRGRRSDQAPDDPATPSGGNHHPGGGSATVEGANAPTIGPAVDQVALSPQTGAEGVVADDPTQLLTTSAPEEGPGMTDLDVRDVRATDDPASHAAPSAPDGAPEQAEISTLIRPSTAPRLPAGTVLVDRYRLEEILAYSEPTVTWRAFDLTLSRSVLVHLLPSTDERAPRLLAAARRAAGATDSRFLRVLDAVEGAQVPGHPQSGSSYIVCEYATGQSLETMLATAPLTGLEAAWLVREVADAMAAVHAVDLHHGRLSPDTVIVTPSGNLKIVGLLIEQAMRPESSHAPLPGGGRLDLEPQDADLLDLGRLLYAALVGRWPGGPAYGLPDAPSDGQHWMTPRQIRAGVSPALDRITEAVLGRPPRHHLTPIESVPELVAALSRTLGPADASSDLERRLRQPVPQVAGTDPRRTWASLERPGTPPAPVRHTDDQQPTEQLATVVRSTPATTPATRTSVPVTPAATPTAATTAPPAARPAGPTLRTVAASPVSPSRRPLAGPPVGLGSGSGATAVPLARRSRQPRRWIAVLLALVVLIVVAALVLAFGPDRGGTAAPTEPSASSPTADATAAAGTPIRIATARDFDPQGTDARPPRENPGEVPNAYDGDASTRWRTVTYQGNPKLGGIKRGVGLVLDLGTPQPVSAVALQLSGTGTSVQVRVPEGDAATVRSPDLSSDGGWRTVGSAAKVGSTATVALDSPVSTRYVLVYLTSLPKEGSGYRGGIYEVEVRA